MRRLYRASQRYGHPLLSDPGRLGRRTESDHDRRPQHEQRTKGLDRAGRSAMRLLSVRTDHAGGRIALHQQETDARADYQSHGRQHLPLRHISSHRACDSTRRSGGLSHDYPCEERLARHQHQPARIRCRCSCADIFIHPWRDRPRRRGDRSYAAYEVQRLGEHWLRQYDFDRLSNRGNGAGRLHVIAVDTCGRVGCRLVQSEDRIRASQSQGVREHAPAFRWGANYRSERIRSGILHAAALGRRAGP